MSNFKLKPTHAPVKAYYETLEKFGRGKFDNEGNIRRAFESLLEKCARPFDRFVVGNIRLPAPAKDLRTLAHEVEHALATEDARFRIPILILHKNSHHRRTIEVGADAVGPAYARPHHRGGLPPSPPPPMS